MSMPPRVRFAAACPLRQRYEASATTVAPTQRQRTRFGRGQSEGKDRAVAVGPPNSVVPYNVLPLSTGPSSIPRFE